MNQNARAHLEEAERRVEESRARRRALEELSEARAVDALDLEPIKARLALRGEDLACYLLDRGLEDIEALVAEAERLRGEARP